MQKPTAEGRHFGDTMYAINDKRRAGRPLRSSIVRGPSVGERSPRQVASALIDMYISPAKYSYFYKQQRNAAIWRSGD